MAIMNNIFDVNDLINSTARLIEIMKIEIEMISKMKLTGLHKLHDEKLRLTEVVEGYKKIIIANPSIKDSFSSETRAKLKSMAQEFGSLAEEGEMQVLKAKKVHSMVMDAIRKTIDKKLSGSKGYTDKGSVSYSHRKKSETPPVTMIESC